MILCLFDVVFVLNSINKFSGGLLHNQQELFEGILAFILVIILTLIVFWIGKVSHNIQSTLEKSVDQVLLETEMRWYFWKLRAKV